MDLIRQQVYDKIKTAVSPVEVSMSRPEKLENLPIVTYYISDNNGQYGLDKSIGKQETEVVIDIWTDKPTEGDTLLNLIEASLSQADFLLSFSSDIPDPSGISHITSRFNY